MAITQVIQVIPGGKGVALLAACQYVMLTLTASLSNLHLIWSTPSEEKFLLYIYIW